LNLSCLSGLMLSSPAAAVAAVAKVASGHCTSDYQPKRAAWVYVKEYCTAVRPNRPHGIIRPTTCCLGIFVLQADGTGSLCTDFCYVIHSLIDTSWGRSSSSKVHGAGVSLHDSWVAAMLGLLICMSWSRMCGHKQVNTVVASSRQPEYSWVL
jgi:hypothetical protein